MSREKYCDNWSVRCVALIILLAGAALAQRVADPAQLPAVVRDFRPDQVHPTLPCTVRHANPYLDFGRRFQAGYVAQIPLNLYQGGGHHWYIVFRVTPERGRTVLFLDSLDVPTPAGRDFDAQIGGAFILGEGRYDVKWSLFDDEGRVCRQEWSLDSRPAKDDRLAQFSIPTGAVRDLSFQPTIVSASGATKGPRQITVLLNSILLSAPWLAATHNADSYVGTGQLWGNLLSILEIMVKRFSEASVRLVVFSLHENREVFREDNFALSEIAHVAHLADGTKPWTVNVGTLQNRGKGWSLLANLVKQEMQANSPSDAVLFLGLPSGSFGGKVPTDFPAADRKRPHYFRLQYLPNRPGLNTDSAPNSSAMARASGGHGPGAIPELTVGSPPPADSIADAVHSLKGQTLAIYSPDDLMKAFNTIERESVPH